MTLPTIDQARSWRGLTLVATDNEPVGRIEAIYVDRTTRQPEWALVLTGLFGSARTFVPLADAVQRGDIVRVPHHTSVVRDAPRLEQDAELSEEDEARLYTHYGIQYTTDESSSGLPVGVPASPDGGTPPAATDATTELPAASSRLQADAPAAAGVASGTSQTVSAPTTVTALGEDDAGDGRSKQAAAAGMSVAALAAIAAGLAVLRRRRRQPPSLGERVGQAGREAADALVQAAEEVRRQAVAVTSGEGARRAAKSSRRATRKASRQAAKTGQELADAGLRAAQVALASGLAAAEGSRRAARKAAKAGQEVSEGGRKAARKAAEAGQGAAGSSRGAAKRARKEAVAAAASVEATVESRRRARKRARARKKAAAATVAATAAAARSVAAAPAAAGRRVQQVDAGKRTQKVTPKRRRRSKMKGMGKLGMVVGAAVGYVLGAKAGRERYDQITASARQLLDKPQVKRVVDSAPGDLGARLEQVANKAADKVHEAGDKVAATGSGTTGATTGATTTTTTTPPSSATTTTPSAPSTSAGATTTGTGKRSSASERKPKSS
jgi:PRC-barrel domain